MPKSLQPLFFVLLPAGFILGGCSPGPRPVAVGEDRCAHCLMTVSDARFAAELVTPTGKVYVFDSIECLAGHLHEAAPEIHSLWVTDFHAPGTLLPAAAAGFVQSEMLHSPMGGYLAAFAPEDVAEAVITFGGDVLDWPAVRALAGQPLSPTSLDQ